MRLASALALAATLASPALAQTQYADSSGIYAGLTDFLFLGSTFKGAGGTVGYRFGNGVDAGVRVGVNTYTGDDFVVGPTGGVNRAVGRGWTGRLEGSALFSTSGGTLRTPSYPEYDGATYRVRSLSEDITATVSRSVRVVGSVRLRPTLGLYATSGQTVTSDFPIAGRPRVIGEAGVHLDLPLTFRLFGKDAALTAPFRLPLGGNAPLPGYRYAYAGGGLRLNF